MALHVEDAVQEQISASDLILVVYHDHYLPSVSFSHRFESPDKFLIKEMSEMAKQLWSF
jgi:hypothetical protein